jgi:hypothetical protein
MKISIGFLVLFVSIVCVSCKTTEVPKKDLGLDYEVNVYGVTPKVTTQPEVNLGTIEAVNLNTIQLKTGPINCPNNTTLILKSLKTGICIKNPAMIKRIINVEENVPEERTLVCAGKIKLNLTSRTKGACLKMFAN